jgi:hypothetical protein
MADVVAPTIILSANRERKGRASKTLEIAVVL